MKSTSSVLLQSRPSYDICVLIPVYNNFPGLITALKSIQYLPGKLCVVLVDDGSKEPLSLEKIISEASNGLLIFGVTLPENRGITVALNTGLAWIETNLEVTYIARLDCSDVCAPERFYRQAAYLNDHPEIGLLGTWAIFRNPETGFQYNYTTPAEHPHIIKEMYFRNVFIHPTVMFRTALLNQTGYYPAGYEHVEDYAFFMEFLKRTRSAVLPELLVTCEINPRGISLKNRQVQLWGRSKVIEDYGKSRRLVFLGKLKLKLLEILPYKLILKLKNAGVSR